MSRWDSGDTRCDANFWSALVLRPDSLRGVKECEISPSSVPLETAAKQCKTQSGAPVGPLSIPCLQPFPKSCAQCDKNENHEIRLNNFASCGANAPNAGSQELNGRRIFLGDTHFHTCR